MASVWPRVDLVGAAGERETLEAFLDDYRAAVVRKAGGASEADARRRLVPSATTLGGVVKHLRWVEHAWFQTGLAQRPESDLPPRPSGEDEFRLGPDETLAGMIGEYEAECARSRETAARYALDDWFPDEGLGRCSLRWLYLHLIEETARHAGHIDILREQLDGTVGD
ncbi:MAG TPA: DinB family protein [Streptosporangiales bacterium]